MATDKQTQTTETQVITSKDGNVTIKQPKHGQKRPHVTVLMESDDLVRSQVGGFVNFLREHAVVGLAVGFIIGQQAQLVIKQLVDSFVTPLLSVWLGQDLMKKQFIIHGHGQTPFTWGKFVYGLINFIFVLLFVYIIIKLLNLDKLDKPKV